MACGLAYFIASCNFYIRNDYKSAKRVMYTSFIYLPVVLLALYFCKLN
jgi:protoheme IX farnesyltransferase